MEVFEGGDGNRKFRGARARGTQNGARGTQNGAHGTQNGARGTVWNKLLVVGTGRINTMIVAATAVRRCRLQTSSVPH